MPLFSRRKSETNLAHALGGDSGARAPRSATIPDGRKPGAVHSGSKARSRSSTRDSRVARPERAVPPPLPTKDGRAEWGYGPESASQLRQLPPGAMPSSPPSAQYYDAAPSTPRSQDQYPRRQSSLSTSSTSHDLSFSASSPSAASAISPRVRSTQPLHGTGRQASSTRSSVPFSSPPTPSASRTLSPEIQHNPQYLHTPPRESSRRSSNNPPRSSSAQFARSYSLSPADGVYDYTDAANSIVGIAPSSSFYGGSPASRHRTKSNSSTPAHSPTNSPRSSQQPRHDSLIRRIQSPDDGSAARLPTQRDGSFTRPAARMSRPPQDPSSTLIPSQFAPSFGNHLAASHQPGLASHGPLDALHAHPSADSQLSLPSTHSKQSIFDKDKSSSDDEGLLTGATSVDGFTPPSEQRDRFQFAPSLPVSDSIGPPTAVPYEPLRIDTTPPRSVPLPDHLPLQGSPSRSSRRHAPQDNALQTSISPSRRPASVERHVQDVDQLKRLLHATPPPIAGQPAAGLARAEAVDRSSKSPSPAILPVSSRQHPSPARLGPALSPRSPIRAIAPAAARERETTNAVAVVTRQRQEEERGNAVRDSQAPLNELSEKPEEPTPQPRIRSLSRIERAFSLIARPILAIVLPFKSYRDLVSLQRTSRSLKESLEAEGRELILERFLGAQGYRSFASRNDKRQTFLPTDDLVVLDLRDLAAFRAAQTLTLDDYSRYSRAYLARQLPSSKVMLARATTRAWNRVVLRLRAQAVSPPNSFAPSSFPELRSVKQPVYKPPRAPQLRVWVPTTRGESWMNDQEVVECEREVFRSGRGVWPQMRKGDIVMNVAIESFGNCGRTVFDGRFLRDLSFEFDVIGHVPNWLNMLTLSPSYYHNILASSTSNPVFYLSLSPFVQQLQETIRLESEKVAFASPQGKYLVKTHLYRGTIEVRAGHVLESTAGNRGATGGYEVVHDEWAGKLVLETEGTTEHASLLIARAASKQPTPWRILREKCRPHRLVIT
ncbi:hypothetical protein JCM11491_005401 [Sporobolomyces phaffii]